jgi:hypothetical protein
MSEALNEISHEMTSRVFGLIPWLKQPPGVFLTAAKRFRELGEAFFEVQGNAGLGC